MSESREAKLTSPFEVMGRVFPGIARQHRLFLCRTHSRLMIELRDFALSDWTIKMTGFVAIHVGVALLAVAIGSVLSVVLGTNYMKGIFLSALAVNAIWMPIALHFLKSRIKASEAWAASLSEQRRSDIASAANGVIVEACRDIDTHTSIEQSQREHWKHELCDQANSWLIDLFSDDLNARTEALIALFAYRHRIVRSLDREVEVIEGAITNRYQCELNRQARESQKQRLDQVLGCPVGEEKPSIITPTGAQTGQTNE